MKRVGADLKVNIAKKIGNNISVPFWGNILTYFMVIVIDFFLWTVEDVRAKESCRWVRWIDEDAELPQ